MTHRAHRPLVGRGVMASKELRSEEPVEHHAESPATAICMISVLLLIGNEVGCRHNGWSEKCMVIFLNVCREALPLWSFVLSIYYDIPGTTLHGTGWEAELGVRCDVVSRSELKDLAAVLFPSRTGTCLYFSSAARSCLSATSFVDNINQGLFG